ncbi:M1 family metallopeptidase [Pseudoalteromonas fenneropenaei]|uniref:Aminopeptidase n=1 Tax=Pseudoalteromonas fenneropenaei TaxID=1737459 RepID=A0ABV7CFW0_9GAMM
MLKPSLIAVAVGIASFQAVANEYMIEKLAKPTFQKVTLQLDPSADKFSGSVVIDLKILTATKYIELSGRDYSVAMAKLVGESECELANQILETGKVRFSCEQELPAGNYQLMIDYTAPYNRQSVGLYKTVDQGQPYLFTQFEMSDARRAMPVFDEPSYKIPFQLTITAPDSQKVYANTPVLKQSSKNGLTTHEFDKTPPIPSYLVAMAVGPFESKAVHGMAVPGNIIAPQGKIHLADSAAKNVPPILKALEDYFGLPYPYQKLDSVALPEFPFGAMENAGLVTYREDILLVDPSVSTRGTMTRHLSVIAHEQAHQWFGNLVTMKWWNDLWLNEAFASWMAAKVTQQLYPELENHLSLPQNHVMALDAQLSTKPIRKPIKTEADIMDGLGLAYNKGSAVLSMVENWIGADAFQQGMRNYMKKYAFKNAEAAELWDELGASAKKDVAGVLKSFIEQSAYPLIAVNVAGKTLTLSQSRFANAGVAAPAQLWQVPVTIKYGKGHEVRTTQVLLSDAQAQLQLEFVPEWIYPDAGAFGYYRWQLDDKLTTALLDNATIVLDDRERLALLAATDALLEAGKINADTLLKTIQTFANDDQPVVAQTALKMLAQQKAIYVQNDTETQWQKYVQTIVTPLLAKYGLEAKAGEKESVASLRASLINMLGFDAKDAQVIAEARKQALLYVQDPAKVDPYLAGVYLNIAAYNGDKTLFATFKQHFETTTDPQVRTKLLIALSHIGDLTLQQELLEYAMADKVTASDMRILFGGLTKGKARQQNAGQWIFANYDKLAAKMPPFALPALPQVTTEGCEVASWQQTNDFFAEKVKAVPGYARTLEKLQESVRTCYALKTREASHVNAFLKSTL